MIDDCSSQEMAQAPRCNADSAPQVSGDRKLGNYFDSPVCEEAGIWIPVSVPSMLVIDHEEWNNGFCSNGADFPEGDITWDHFAGEEKEMTVRDVVSEMLLGARGKMKALRSREIKNCRTSWISADIHELAWKEMAHTLTGANYGNVKQILDVEPPKWLPDSAASACMLCNGCLHPIMCSRHHCRFCGGIFLVSVQKAGACCLQHFEWWTHRGSVTCATCGLNLVGLI